MPDELESYNHHRGIVVPFLEKGKQAQQICSNAKSSESCSAE